MTWKLTGAANQVFKRNPLDAAICQLRFDPILKVHDRVPDFQDAIRSRFPGYQESEGVMLELTEGPPRQRTVRQHRFIARREPTIALLGDAAVSLEYRDHWDRGTLLSDARLVSSALESCLVASCAATTGASIERAVASFDARTQNSVG